MFTLLYVRVGILLLIHLYVRVGILLLIQLNVRVGIYCSPSYM
jgi:hypothetical protein